MEIDAHLNTPNINNQIRKKKQNHFVISKIQKGCFRNNLAILTKYELLTECKILGIHRYTGLNCQQIMNKIADKRKLILKAHLMYHEDKLVVYGDILLLILEFVDFTSNDEEIMQNRYEQIQWARQMKNIQYYCKMTDNTNTLIQWFKYHKYDRFVPLEDLKKCSKTDLWNLYLAESEKIFILSLSPYDIFLSENIILEWFNLLYYKQCKKTHFQYKKKIFPKIDWIRCTFWTQYQELQKQFPQLKCCTDDVEIHCK